MEGLVTIVEKSWVHVGMREDLSTCSCAEVKMAQWAWLDANFRCEDLLDIGGKLCDGSEEMTDRPNVGPSVVSSVTEELGKRREAETSATMTALKGNMLPPVVAVFVHFTVWLLGQEFEKCVFPKKPSTVCSPIDSIWSYRVEGYTCITTSCACC